jgi:hypothetical protein
MGKSWNVFITYLSCKVPSKGLDCETFGISHEIFKEISHEFNLTVTMDEYLPNDWGVIPNNGNWSDPNAFSGLFAEVMKDQIDLAMPYYITTFDREQHVDFSQPLIGLAKYKVFINVNLLPKGKGPLCGRHVRT